MAGLGVPGAGPARSPYLGDAPPAPEKVHEEMRHLARPGWISTKKKKTKRRRTYVVKDQYGITHTYVYPESTAVPFPKEFQQDDEDVVLGEPQSSEPPLPDIKYVIL